MPPRVLRDILVVDRSLLACNMYQLLFSAVNRYRVRFADEFESLFKKSRRLRPDLLIVNSNALSKELTLAFPSPAILIASKDRIDLREGLHGKKNVVLIEKPFYPFDLLSIANRLVGNKVIRMTARKRKARD